ncbi:hypothetical protein [Roseateles sp.]|uniref:hypothetical protein n=1 Tax=Roseateles sp. TaxID=1971397 RepID=UPI002F40472F
MKQRRDVRALRREKRRPWSQQPPDQDRQAELEAAFAELDREQARRIQQSLKGSA